jgi:hypothetical protein
MSTRLVFRFAFPNMVMRRRFEPQLPHEDLELLMIKNLHDAEMT